MTIVTGIAQTIYNIRFQSQSVADLKIGLEQVTTLNKHCFLSTHGIAKGVKDIRYNK